LNNVRKYQIPLFYVNHVGAQTELLFDGGSLVVNNSARIFQVMDYFEEDIKIFDTLQLNADGDHAIKNPPKVELIHNALIMGIRNYFHKLGFSKAILGLSGGIDSAVTLVLATLALGKGNVHAVLLPSRFSSTHSIKDAEELVKNLGCSMEIIPINSTYEIVLKNLKNSFSEKPFDVAEENLQARIRGLILMALCNKLGYIMLNTSNKSEAAVGYGTLYGDINGGLSVLGDVYKTEVYELATFINREK